MDCGGYGNAFWHFHRLWLVSRMRNVLYGKGFRSYCIHIFHFARPCANTGASVEKGNWEACRGLDWSALGLFHSLYWGPTNGYVKFASMHDFTVTHHASLVLVNAWHRRGLGGGMVIPPFISPTRLLLVPIVQRLLDSYNP